MPPSLRKVVAAAIGGGAIAIASVLITGPSGNDGLEGVSYIPYKDIVCSCPLISRQGLYLKLTLPADVDILAESDNPTHYADGFHCNARSPLQGYAMPFLHSVSA